MAEADVSLHVLPRNVGTFFARVPRWVFSRKVQSLIDGVLAATAVMTAFLLRFDFRLPAASVEAMFIWALVFAIARPVSHLLSGCYRTTWRFFHLKDAFRLALCAFPVSIAALVFRVVEAGGAAIPYSAIVIEYGAFLAFAASVRLLRRVTYEAVRPTVSRSFRTLLVGNDTSLASAIRHVEVYRDVNLVGLLSEEPDVVGLRIAGVSVLGTPASLPRLLTSMGVEVVILSGADLQCIGDVVSCATEFGAQVRILPSARDLIDGKVQVSRTVAIDQIAKRRQAMPQTPHPAVIDCLQGRTVLVSGAGGSIGSEIVRQISGLPVSRLVVLDHDENSIFELISQSNALAGKVEFVPIVGDIRDRTIVHRTFSEHRPDVVLHAAAYKHVPIMEFNSCEAVLNNVCGTRELVDAAIEFGCERFVMISTDKAVRPSSVMGATKRVAEVLVQHRAAEAQRKHGTHFACVRFGNVMGSRGSVVPIFLKQIAAGGPVTITHEDMTRYFMTIPQAVQLVLQAATLASSGDVYMLDMGNPVKIIEFAKELIQLAGLRPGKDIEIKVVGIRPGEKLHEQLWSEDATVTRTEFPYVFRVKAPPLNHDFPKALDALEQTARTRQSHEAIYELLQHLPIDFLSTATTKAAVGTD